MNARESAPAAVATASRETVRRGRTRERLMDAAYRMFAKHGINGTSIEAVAEDAGFTRGAFYSNFGSKTELFFALAERENRSRLEGLRQYFPPLLEQLRSIEGKPERNLIARLAAEILDAQPYDRQWCLMYGEFRMLAMRDAAVAGRFLEIDRGLRSSLAKLIDGVMETVGLRVAIDSAELTRLLITLQESATQEAILSSAEDPERAVRDIVMRSLPTVMDRLIEMPEAGS